MWGKIRCNYLHFDVILGGGPGDEQAIQIFAYTPWNNHQRGNETVHVMHSNGKALYCEVMRQNHNFQKYTQKYLEMINKKI